MGDTQGSLVIVGAGHAGGTAAALARRLGWGGPITLIGEEPVPPYQRPPLSKAWLAGKADHESLALRPANFYGEHNIDLRCATLVTGIDLAAHRLALSTGEALAYDRLILALGSRARPLPVPGVGTLRGILELRTAADADLLKAALGPGRRIAVVGGGYIGLEAAASAHTLGAQAVVSEREERVLARVASRPISTFFQDTHRARGIVLELGASVVAFEGDNGHVAGVRLADGRVIACDIALVGIGALANDDLARQAGLTCDDGIVVDLAARTSDPHVYAIGDCTRRPLPRFGSMARLESVQNALEQAKQAASDLCGKPPPAPEVPWFWSDQFDVKLQIAGLPIGVEDVVMRGDPQSGKFALFHLDQGGRLQAVEAVNAGAEFMAGRLLIGKQAIVAREALQDVSVPMNKLAAAAPA
jgi:3-phenylpropionate/trans-cinnamate dioxygenase ferredoxin reductase subunit